MSLLDLCQWLATTNGSIALHESIYIYPLVESAHVLTLCVFVGSASMLDLRLLGLSFRRVPARELARRLMPWMVVGFLVMIVTGALLSYAIPVRSYQSIFFRIKVVMLIMAGLNAWIFHVRSFRRVGEWNKAAVPPRAARVAGAASLILWAAIIIAGRMIAYNWFDCGRPQPAWVNVAAGCIPVSQ